MSHARRPSSARLARLVRVLVAPNPGPMTGPGTNTYVVGGGPRLVIDPAVDDPAYLESLLEVAGEVEAVLVTHRHPDHTGGVRAVVERTGAVLRALLPEPIEGVEVHPIADRELIEAGGAELRALHTPGHARDHLCFWYESELALFSGDNVLGEGTSVIAPPEGNMRAYLDSLRRMQALPVERIFPGHFRALDAGAEVLGRYIEHRAQRESLIVDALRRGDASIDDIVARAYMDTPTEMHGMAKLSALAHLEMLKERGKVIQRAERWSLIGT